MAAGGAAMIRTRRAGWWRARSHRASRWRRALEASAAPSVAFAPVVVTSGSPSADPLRTDGDDRIEIVLRNGRRVLVSETVGSGALARILATAERA